MKAILVKREEGLVVTDKPTIYDICNCWLSLWGSPVVYVDGPANGNWDIMLVRFSGQNEYTYMPAREIIKKIDAGVWNVEVNIYNL